MPSWFTITLDITGPLERIAELRALVKTSKSEMDFEAIIPPPTVVDLKSLAKDRLKLTGEDADTSTHSSLHEWMHDNWAGECVPSHVEWQSEEEAARRGVSASVYYRTIRGPGHKIPERLAQLFPDLEIKHFYHSFDVEWRGSWTYKSGVLTAHEESIFTPEALPGVAPGVEVPAGQGDGQSRIQDDINLFD